MSNASLKKSENNKTTKHKKMFDLPLPDSVKSTILDVVETISRSYLDDRLFVIARTKEMTQKKKIV